MKLVLLMFVFVYSVNTAPIQNETEASVPVQLVNRRQGNDFYNTKETCDVTYLVSDEQCVQNQDLFNGNSNSIGVYILLAMIS